MREVKVEEKTLGRVENAGERRQGKASMARIRADDSWAPSESAGQLVIIYRYSGLGNRRYYLATDEIDNAGTEIK
jgi:hypothetical protein